MKIGEKAYWVVRIKYICVTEVIAYRSFMSIIHNLRHINNIYTYTHKYIFVFILGQTSNSSVTFDTVLNNAAGSPFLEQIEEGTILKEIS